MKIIGINFVSYVHEGWQPSDLSTWKCRSLMKSKKRAGNFRRPSRHPHSMDTKRMHIINNFSSVAEPVLFGRSWSRWEGPAPGSGSTLDKTEEILNDIVFVWSNTEKMLIKKQILKSKWIFSSKEGGTLLKKIFFLMVESLVFSGAGARAGAGEKITRSRSKTDRLSNTEFINLKI